MIAIVAEGELCHMYENMSYSIAPTISRLSTLQIALHIHHLPVKSSQITLNDWVSSKSVLSVDLYQHIQVD